MDIFDVSVLLHRVTFWPGPFDLNSVLYTVPRTPTHNPYTNFHYPVIIGYWVVNYWIWSHICYLKHSLRMRHVTWPITGAKMVHIFEIPDPNLSIHFVTFRALRRRLSHVIGENSVYPIVKATKLTAHARDLCIGGSPKTTRNNFLSPNCLFNIQLIWDYDDD